MHWTRSYVGLPWVLAGRDHSGVDCWGLLWLVYAEQLGIRVPSYVDETVDDPEREEIALMIRGEQGQGCWVAVDKGQERTFDMVVLRRTGIESHIGIVVARGQMLHVVSGSEARVEHFDRGRWPPRLAGIYRHVSAGDRHAS